MGRTEEFLKREKDTYGKVYVDISFAIDNISPFLEDEVLKRRKYAAKLPIVKKYIELIETAEGEVKKGGFFNLFSDDKYAALLNGYKRDNQESLSQLQKCANCACLNCSAECSFDGCLGCRAGSSIKNCDHKKINVTLHDNFTLNLTNNNTGKNDRYEVLATLHDVEKNQKYIIIQNQSSNEKFILYYYPGISEDNYGEINDPQEFDFIVSTFQSIEE